MNFMKKVFIPPFLGVLAMASYIPWNDAQSTFNDEIFVEDAVSSTHRSPRPVLEAIQSGRLAATISDVVARLADLVVTVADQRAAHAAHPVQL